jgi:hypothetical protein
MTKFIAVSILSLIMLCCANPRYMRRDLFINLKDKISTDSIVVQPILFSIARNDGNSKIFFSQPGHSRPDTIRNHLWKVLNKVIPNTKLLFSKKHNCSGSNFNTQNLGNRPEIFLNVNTYKCLQLDTSYYNLIVYFSMVFGEVQDGMSSEFCFIHPVIVIIKNGKVVYHKQLVDSERSRRSNFPKGSTDREQFPYFPPKQIERVVNRVTKEILSVIE